MLTQCFADAPWAVTSPSSAGSAGPQPHEEWARQAGGRHFVCHSGGGLGARRGLRVEPGSCWGAASPVPTYTCPSHPYFPPPPQIQPAPSRGYGFFMRLKAAQPRAGRHFQDSAALWLLTAQIWPLLGILEFAPPSSDRAWWAWGQAWLCCTQRGKFLSPCLYGTGRRRSSWCFHCQLSFPRWPHAPHIPHLTQLRLGAAISFCLAPHARTACPSSCFANGLSHPHRTVREAVAKGRKLSLPSTGRVPGAGNPPPPPPP